MSATRFYPKAKRPEKFSQNEQLELMFDLINSFRIVKDPIETADFLQDLLTAKEIKNLAKRLRIAKLLLSGLTHEEITRHLHCSYASVAKVSLWLNQGREGFRKVIVKLPSKYNFPKNLPPIPLEFQLPKAILTTIQYALAKSQNTKLDKFMEGVRSKGSLDKLIREYQSPQFKNLKRK